MSPTWWRPVFLDLAKSFPLPISKCGNGLFHKSESKNFFNPYLPPSSHFGFYYQWHVPSEGRNFYMFQFRGKEDEKGWEPLL